jgi:large subunit ribosomal protein L15
MVLEMFDIRLNNLQNNSGSKKARKRICRGIGSGKGKTGGRGVKGQKARSGVAIKGFEGGQMPIIKRLPKRGFNCLTSKIYQVINLSELLYFASVDKIDPNNLIDKEVLCKVGRLKNINKPVKLLCDLENLDLKLSVKFDAYSSSAKIAIEKSGGKVL